jgi:hypothetical protein
VQPGHRQRIDAQLVFQSGQGAFVEQQLDGLGVADRRDAADGIAGGRAHELRIRAQQRLPVARVPPRLPLASVASCL